MKFSQEGLKIETKTSKEELKIEMKEGEIDDYGEQNCGNRRKIFESKS